MSSSNPHISNLALKTSKREVKGCLKQIENESYYCIENYDHMDPFFMSIVSSSDLWMFISSSGSLTAGRQNNNNAIFPYYTDDKIHESAEITGPKTIVRVEQNGRMLIWEPFSDRYQGLYDITRNLYKNISGSKIIFEEINNELKLSFTYTWMSSDNLGWIRRCRLTNLSGIAQKVDILDGLQNILPFGIMREIQSTMSTLMDAYKVADWIPKSNLGLFRMSSIPVDRAEPSEALRTNCVWIHGLEPTKVLLSSKQVSTFRKGGEIKSEHNVFGVKTGIFAYNQITLNAGDEKIWYMVADVAKDYSDVVALQNILAQKSNLDTFIAENVKQSSDKLEQFVALADGIQSTGDPLIDRRHFANVMFNIMRGGIFEKSYSIDVSDFVKHLEQSNCEVHTAFKDKLTHLNSTISIQELISFAQTLGNPDLVRLAYEYLPISFSRRHGDPSRPWNFFDINLKNADGTSSLNYQGNWRDIFQNWEALALSFPHFLPGMIARFLNASTADGYNPYRITREGFDWEVPEPDNPWAYIGYWGDHQIIYLLRLLELHSKYFPNQLFKQFSEPAFVYANVPYTIKAYSDIIKNPQDTIYFNRELHAQLVQRSKAIGADGKLVTLRSGDLLRVSFIEKILVSLFTKLSNFVPGAGIWLNTQRPEWNDANNALVGNGASMVTLYQLRRYINFFIGVIEKGEVDSFSISEEVKQFVKSIEGVLHGYSSNLTTGFNDKVRRQIVDELGAVGSDYRAKVYAGFSGNKLQLSPADLLALLNLSLRYVDQTIATNKRSDGLYHSYNLIEFAPNELRVQHLQLMLEGQASVLGSGLLSVEATKELMAALFSSNLWREDQKSFLLYPFRELPNFLEKNVIPQNLFSKSELLRKLVEMGNTQVVKRDDNNQFHFNADLKNVGILKDVLSKISVNYTPADAQLVYDIYEEVFQHRYFTGRSGSFYKYEGLGSIYWHLVSKLLLAVGESITNFALAGNGSNELQKLVDYYYRIKEGIGAHKCPSNYGAFPTDPYSHTPSMMGAQQPGMTGQVKEDIISRFNELGLMVQNGQISFNTTLIQDADFDENGELSITYCSTPIKFRKGEKKGVEITWNDKTKLPVTFNYHSVAPELSNMIFSRTAEIGCVWVYV